MLIPGPQRLGIPEARATPETTLDGVDILSLPKYVGELSEL